MERDEGGRLEAVREARAGSAAGPAQRDRKRTCGKMGAHARELVVACHGALLRGQHEQRKSAEQVQQAHRRGLARAAGQQTAMAADLRALAALLARCTAQRKAEASAKKRLAAWSAAPPAASGGAVVGGTVRGPPRGATPSAGQKTRSAARGCCG